MKIRSRKLWAFLATALVQLLPVFVHQPEVQDAVRGVLYAGMTYIIGQGAVDAAATFGKK